MKKIVCYSQFPRAEGMPRPTGPHGKSQGQLGGRSAGRGHRGGGGGCGVGTGNGQESLFHFWQEEMGEAGQAG